jgi:hypothetical protein
MSSPSPGIVSRRVTKVGKSDEVLVGLCVSEAREAFVTSVVWILLESNGGLLRLESAREWLTLCSSIYSSVVGCRWNNLLLQESDNGIQPMLPRGLRSVFRW